ncbi:MAG: hypothetical protein EOO40_06140 [Deltaproteobacteria bacterium]|nr:MAG: hypothetical protein EOO40_06140 [Deltaproteobacteria bacterium]
MFNRLVSPKTAQLHQDVSKTTAHIAKIMREEGTDKHNLYFPASDRAQQEIMALVQRDLSAAFVEAPGSLFKRQAVVQNRGSRIQLMSPPGAAWPVFVACQNVLKDNASPPAQAPLATIVELSPQQQAAA